MQDELVFYFICSLIKNAESNILCSKAEHSREIRENTKKSQIREVKEKKAVERCAKIEIL